MNNQYEVWCYQNGQLSHIMKTFRSEKAARRYAEDRERLGVKTMVRSSGGSECPLCGAVYDEEGYCRC